MTIQGTASATASSVAIPAHQPGDLIFVCARNPSNSRPTAPAAGGTVPVWVTVQTGNLSGLSLTSASAIATASNHTTGTWTNLADICVLVLRPDSTKQLRVGNSIQLNGTVATIDYPALTLLKTDGTSWGVRVGTRTIAATTVANPPAGWTNQIVQPATGLMAVHTLAALVANPTLDSVSTPPSTAVNRAHTIEVLEKAGALVYVASGSGSTAGIYGAQLETGSLMTSYIPTTTTAVTRAADSATFTIPAGIGHLTYTFDDNSTQVVAVSPGSYTIPSSLNRPNIKSIVGSA